MGLHFVLRFVRNGHAVLLLDRSASRAQRIRRSGLTSTGLSTLKVSGSSFSVSASAAALKKALRGSFPDWIFVFVKAHQTAEAVRRLIPLIGPGTVVVTLQNGRGLKERIARATGAGRVLEGFLTEGVTKISDTKIRHAADGAVVLDKNADRPSDVARLARLLRRAGFAVRIRRDFEQAQWTKLIANACINPLGALGDVPNGALAKPPLEPVVRRVADECVTVLKKSGLPLRLKKIQNSVLTLARKTARNMNSMAQDLRRGRPTERAFILGPFLEEARRLKIRVPLLRTLDTLLNSAERRYL